MTSFLALRASVCVFSVVSNFPGIRCYLFSAGQKIRPGIFGAGRRHRPHEPPARPFSAHVARPEQA